MGNKKSIYVCVLAAAIMTPLLLANCGGLELYDPFRVETHQKAGTVNLAVTMVAPWEEYISRLQPKFALTADNALKKVIPKTTILEEKLLDALGLKAKVGLPTSSTTIKKEETISGGTASTSETKTEERKPGTLPTTSAKPKVPTQGATSLTGIEDKDKAVSEEPMLEYSAAAALYQEVQLLNRYVEDAALKYGCQAYVVRMQLAVFPYARNQPYDVYTTFGFFPSFELGKDKKYGKAFALPLLVTDNLEGTLKSRTTDTIRQLAFALGFMIHGVTGEVGIDKMNEKIRSILGTDLNSLLTVSSVTDSSIRVRLGAMRQPTAEYAMIPRTHSITFLLMVEKELLDEKKAVPHVRVVAKTVMRDSKDGKVLPAPKSGMIDASALAILKRYDEDWKPPKKTEKGKPNIGDLFKALYTDNFPWFREILIELTKDSENSKMYRSLSREIWLRFIELAASDDFAGATFDLPRPLKLNLPETKQAVLLLDDGTSAVTGYFRGGKGMIPNRMNARLNLKLKDGQSIPIMAKSVEVGSRGNDPVFTFPSLYAWDIVDMNRDGSRLKGSEIEIYHSTRDRWTLYSDEEAKPDEKPKLYKANSYKNIFYRLKDPPDPPPNFQIRTPLDSIEAGEKGKGELKLYFEAVRENGKPLVDAVEITLSNAEVVKVQSETPGKARLRRGKITVTEDTTLVLSLIKLKEGNTITIKSAGKKGGKSSGGPHDDIDVNVEKAKKK